MLTIHRQTLLITRSVADAARTLLETDLSLRQRTQSEQLGTGPAQSLRISPSLVIYSPKSPVLPSPGIGTSMFDVVVQQIQFVRIVGLIIDILDNVNIS